MLVDSHCHLSYYKDGLDAVLAAADSLAYMLNIGTDLDSLEDVLSINHEKVYHAIGVHPDSAHKYSIENVITTLSNKIESNNRILAIGEIGLDAYRTLEFIEEQKKAFIAQIDVANKYNLPIVIHTRNADDIVIPFLEYANSKNVKGVLHSFTGSLETAIAGIKNGFLISFSGIITFKNAEEVRKVVDYVSIDKILIETDSPFLAPEPYRGKTNQPSYVYQVAKKIAEIKNVPLEYVINTTYKNFVDTFMKTIL